jgi:hypothetical protein
MLPARRGGTPCAASGGRGTNRPTIRVPGNAPHAFRGRVPSPGISRRVKARATARRTATRLLATLAIRQGRTIYSPDRPVTRTRAGHENSRRSACHRAGQQNTAPVSRTRVTTQAPHRWAADAGTGMSSVRTPLAWSVKNFEKSRALLGPPGGAARRVAVCRWRGRRSCRAKCRPPPRRGTTCGARAQEVMRHAVAPRRMSCHLARHAQGTWHDTRRARAAACQNGRPGPEKRTSEVMFCAEQ